MSNRHRRGWASGGIDRRASGRGLFYSKGCSQIRTDLSDLLTVRKDRHCVCRPVADRNIEIRVEQAAPSKRYRERQPGRQQTRTEPQALQDVSSARWLGGRRHTRSRRTVQTVDPVTRDSGHSMNPRSRASLGRFPVMNTAVLAVSLITAITSICHPTPSLNPGRMFWL